MYDAGRSQGVTMSVSAVPQSISQLPPGTAWWVFAIVILGLVLHIGGGSLSILSGAGAVSVAKGERLHRRFGTIFVVAMLTMATAATALAVAVHQRGNVAVGVLTFYLVGTAWTTARNRGGRAGTFEKAAFVLAVGISVLFLTWGVIASKAGSLDGYPPVLYYVVSGVAALFAMLDLKVILKGGLTETQRIARHLWRMCVAFFLATGSFFIGQQKVMPKAWHGSWVLFALGLAPLVVMAFWLVRVRFKPWRTRAAVAAE